MPARRDPLTGRFLPAQAAQPVAAPAPARRRIRASHAALLALLVILAAAALVVFT